MSTTKPLEETQDTAKVRVIQSSFLARLIQAEQDELTQSQRNIEKMLQAWNGHEREEEKQ